MASYGYSPPDQQDAILGEGGEPEYIVPHSKLHNFVASVAAGKPADPRTLPPDQPNASPVPASMMQNNAMPGPAPMSARTPPFLPPQQARQTPPALGPPTGMPPASAQPPQPPPLGTPGQPPPQQPMPAPPQQPKVGIGRMLLGNLAGRVLGPQVAGEIERPGFARQQAQYQAQMGAQQAQTGLAKAQADINKSNQEAGEAQQRGRYLGQQADTLSAEGKRAPRGNYIPVPGGGLFDADAGEWVKEPPAKATADTMEIDPEKGKALGLKPLPDGRYVIPKEGIGPFLTSAMKPEPTVRPITHIETDDKGQGTLVSVDPGTGKVSKTPLGAIGKSKTENIGSPGSTPNDPKDIANGIISGIQPPTLTGLYRNAAPVRAELARQGYDLMTATRDWQAVSRHLSTLNGVQQERLRQAITFTHDSIGQIEQLYGEWQATGLPTGFKDFNKAALVAATHLPGNTGAVAQNLLTQLNDLTSELGTVYKGGNSSTDESLRLAAENLKADWNKDTFARAVKQLKVNLTIRKNSILTSQPAGVSPNSPYAPPQSPTETPSAAPQPTQQGKSFDVTDPRGVIHHFPNQQAADHFKQLAHIQ